MAGLKALGLLIGMIVGAGIFGLPYAVWKAGMVWSGIHFVVAFFIVTTIHLLYGRLLYDHPSRHRLPGYIQQYFGRRWAEVTFLFRLFSYYGYLLAYGVVGGVFLENLFPIISNEYYSFFLLTGLAPLLFLNIKGLGTLNLLFTVPLVVFPSLLFLFVAPQAELDIVAWFPQESSWFLPYGIFLFALSGASVIPEVVDMVGRHRKKMFYEIVIVGMLLVSLVYVVFTLAILGIAQGPVPVDAVSVLEASGRPLLFLIGSLIGIFAILTSYVTLGLELRYTFEYDYRQSRLWAWLLTTAVPIILYLFGINNFVLILSFIGAVGVGVEGICIVLLSQKISGTNRMLVVFLIAVLALGALLEVTGVLGKMVLEVSRYLSTIWA